MAGAGEVIARVTEALAALEAPAELLRKPQAILVLALLSAGTIVSVWPASSPCPDRVCVRCGERVTVVGSLFPNILGCIPLALQTTPAQYRRYSTRRRHQPFVGSVRRPLEGPPATFDMLTGSVVARGAALNFVQNPAVESALACAPALCACPPDVRNVLYCVCMMYRVFPLHASLVLHRGSCHCGNIR
jgi:hypothetical protein